ncbi:hypothetical protein MA16_Dca024651 [Dendrobium catenatum]|uniref:Uncharacterized protein n=1 Tax=Dendrobium catenatum TaxID=906689 RepID=A0A2I0VAX6_9ASPA|nr:hypothetical protein MA16_Dca024651 [Dendrobium catenatum]
MFSESHIERRRKGRSELTSRLPSNSGPDADLCLFSASDRRALATPATDPNRQPPAACSGRFQSSAQAPADLLLPPPLCFHRVQPDANEGAQTLLFQSPCHRFDPVESSQKGKCPPYLLAPGEGTPEGKIIQDDMIIIVGVGDELTCSTGTEHEIKQAIIRVLQGCHRVRQNATMEEFKIDNMRKSSNIFTLLHVKERLFYADIGHTLPSRDESGAATSSGTEQY